MRALVLLVFLSLGAGQTLAASTVQSFNVTGIVLDATKYNGCLVKISPGPETHFPECTSGFITLGCDGAAGVPKAQAAQHLSAAQLALVSDTKVFMRVYDEAPAGNAYCLVDRVDNTKTPADP